MAIIGLLTAQTVLVFSKNPLPIGSTAGFSKLVPAVIKILKVEVEHAADLQVYFKLPSSLQMSNRDGIRDISQNQILPVFNFEF